MFEWSCVLLEWFVSIGQEFISYDGRYIRKVFIEKHTRYGLFKSEKSL